MDKRLSIYDVVLIAKATVESKTDVYALKSALVHGLEKQEIQRVKSKAAYLERSLDNIIEGRPTAEGTDYIADAPIDIVEAATDLPRREIAEGASFENRPKSKPRGWDSV